MQNNETEKELRLNDKSGSRKRWFMKDLRKVVEEADVILEVLDARDPMGCRCPALERMIQGQMSAESTRPKRIILVLNKIDLVPPHVVEQWVTYLRREFPVIAFKASTQKGGSIGHATSTSLAFATKSVGRSTCIGAGQLMEILKKYCMSLNLKTAINVGIIGYPNVGKSSLINSLKRSKAVGVGSTPGFTTSIQHVRLDKHITLLDSPGVLFSDEARDPDLLLRNCIRLEQLEDPEEAITPMLNKVSKEDMMQFYEIADFNSEEEFLYLVAHKRNKLKKGGVADLKAAARSVLKDWNEGKIKYFSSPPEVDNRHFDSKEESETTVVSSWGPDFDIDELLNQNTQEAVSMLPEPTTATVRMRSSETRGLLLEAKLYNGSGDMDDGDDDGMGMVDEETMQEEKNAFSKSGSFSINPFASHDSMDANMDNDGGWEDGTTVPGEKSFDPADDNNPQANRKQKMSVKAQQKKLRKEARRQLQQEEPVSSNNQNNMQDEDVDMDQEYDFGRDWQ